MWWGWLAEEVFHKLWALYPKCWKAQAVRVTRFTGSITLLKYLEKKASNEVSLVLYAWESREYEIHHLEIAPGAWANTVSFTYTCHSTALTPQHYKNYYLISHLRLITQTQIAEVQIKLEIILLHFRSWKNKGPSDKKITNCCRWMSYSWIGSCGDGVEGKGRATRVIGVNLSMPSSGGRWCHSEREGWKSLKQQTSHVDLIHVRVLITLEASLCVF